LAASERTRRRSVASGRMRWVVRLAREIVGRMARGRPIDREADLSIVRGRHDTQTTCKTRGVGLV
jgi:hypothetical protein